jgi:hypothetical protein
MTPSAGLEATHYVGLCIAVLEVVSFALTDPHSRISPTTLVPILKSIATHTRNIPLVRHSIKNYMCAIYRTLDMSSNKELEHHLFTIWAELDLTSVEDYYIIRNLINTLDLQELANRAERFRIQIHEKSTRQSRIEILSSLSEEISEVFMSTVRSGRRQSLVWRLYILLYPTNDTEEILQMQSFFEFILGCLPGRMLELGSDGCVCLVENLAILCLMADYCDVLQHMDLSMQHHCGLLICLTGFCHSGPISDDDKEWQKLLVHINHLQLWTIHWCNTLILKAIRVLPSNRYTFYYFAYVTDQLKVQPNIDMWNNGHLLLQTLWNKHQSLETFCKYVSTMNFSSKELFGAILQLVGHMNCVESQSYKMKLHIKFRGQMDVFDFEMTCAICENNEIGRLENSEVFQLLCRLWENPHLATFINTARKTVRKVLMHDLASCKFELVENFLGSLTTDLIPSLAPLLRAHLPEHLLTQNWTRLLPLFERLLIQDPVPSIDALGSILRDSMQEPIIFFEVAKFLIGYACGSTQLLRSLAIRQLLRIPEGEYGVILKELSLWATERLDENPKILQTVCQVLKINPSEFFELTWPYTLPVLVANRNQSILFKVCTKGKESDEINTVKRLIHYSGDITAHLLVYGPPGSMDYFLQLIEAATSGNELSLESLFKTNQLQLVRNLIVECGDMDEMIVKKVISVD